jgi:Cu-processing system permease protein
MTAPGESPVLLCARQELTPAVRSRSTPIFAAVFALLSLAVASSGYVLSGGGGVQDFARTAASLVQPVLVTLSILVWIAAPLAAAVRRLGKADL